MNSGPQVVAKAVPFHYIEGQLLVALTSLTDKNPRKWELPGTSVYSSHTSLGALEQMLRTECGLTSQNVRYREQLYTFERPSEDLLQRNTIYVTYLYLSPELLWHKGARHIGLFPVDRLPHISHLDQDSITYALERLKSKALYTTLPAFLLPKIFDLHAYQQIFETLTGMTVDKRNFRKKLQSLAILHPTTKQSSHKRGETMLYQLNDPTISLLSRPFMQEGREAPAR